MAQYKIHGRAVHSTRTLKPDERTHVADTVALAIQKAQIDAGAGLVVVFDDSGNAAALCRPGDLIPIVPAVSTAFPAPPPIMKSAASRSADYDAHLASLPIEKHQAWNDAVWEAIGTIGAALGAHNLETTTDIAKQAATDLMRRSPLARPEDLATLIEGVVAALATS